MVLCAGCALSSNPLRSYNNRLGVPLKTPFITPHQMWLCKTEWEDEDVKQGVDFDSKINLLQAPLVSPIQLSVGNLTRSVFLKDNLPNSETNSR